MSESLDARVTSQVAMEAEFWRNDPFERPGVDSLENFVNKSQDAAVFLEILREFWGEIRSAKRIVELGGGQGWASCLLKRAFPDAHVTLTDAVPEAIVGRRIWERVFACALDGASAAPAQQLPFPDRSVDVIFCFAAAHHFVDYGAALRETSRVLTTDGVCLWLYEPTSPSWCHAAAESRVNKKRVDVREHVMVPDLIATEAARWGLDVSLAYCTSTAHRGRLATLYYNLLDIIPPLQRVLPCTAHFRIQHRTAATANRRGVL
jgi:SAM-dependent methyltransferase